MYKAKKYSMHYKVLMHIQNFLIGIIVIIIDIVFFVQLWGVREGEKL